MQLICVYVSSVSQHALAVVVEVNEGERSVLLPCQYSGFIPDDPTVMWTRSDLHPKSVHLRREGGDDLTGQNQRYSGRTSMRSDALDTGDFSLTLRKPTKTDSGNYTCSISDGREELRLRDIQLQVKDEQRPAENWRPQSDPEIPHRERQWRIHLHHLQGQRHPETESSAAGQRSEM
uniref:Ig-like domain-containing protein n=1 Tax=Haplochromis burtoni TaxID=8153 RepID=A0A3Q2WNK4_HAPBU